MKTSLLIARKTLPLAFRRFLEIDGTARGAAFAYYAFFSLFPLIVLFVTIGSMFLERDVAIETVIGYAEHYVPLEPEMERSIFDTIQGVVAARGQVGLIASIVLIWGSLQFFRALVRGTNRAWQTEMHNWWQMPLKNLMLLLVLGSALILGMLAPAAARLAQEWLPPLRGVVQWLTNTALATVPTLLLFYGLVFFYRLAPRRPTRFSQVWPAALGMAVLLRGVESLFLFYLRSFADFNVVYGTFGSIMALLLWIYLSGCLVVFGACVTAAETEVKQALSRENKTPEAA